MSERSAALPVGAVVAGYRIEAVLGSGGMGVVYRAAHPVLPRSDALKILGADLSLDDDFRARFVREADLAATLDHPNIVAVYNRGDTDDGRLWIAMQYVAGSDAAAERRAGRMTPHRAVHVIGEVARAVDHAHRRGLLHRDVKPANFLVAAAQEGDEERVLLADFGIARALDDATHLTGTHEVLASLAYTAPETLTGGAVDGRADLYSLGCALFALLTGRAPYAGLPGGAAGVMAAHLTAAVPRVTDLVPTLPSALDDVLAVALAKDPDDRHTSATALAAAASAALAGAAPVTRAATAPAPTGVPGVPGEPARLPAPPSPFESGVSPVAEPLQRPPFTSSASSLLGVASRARRPRRRRRALLAALVVAAVAVGSAAVAVTARDVGGYRMQAFTHTLGTTTLTSLPRAVAALGPGDADAVLALGVQPVVMVAPSGTVPPWERAAVSGEPTVLAGLDVARVAAARPDLILATGPLDAITYGQLSAIAPTITRPAETSRPGWDWQAQLTWIGDTLDREQRAAELVATDRTDQNAVIAANPEVAGRSAAVLEARGASVLAVLTPSYASDYLVGIGMRPPATVQRADGEAALRPLVSVADVAALGCDVLVVARTAADGADPSGPGTLPEALRDAPATIVVVDDADLVAALTGTGGYLANRFLDGSLPQLIADRLG